MAMIKNIIILSKKVEVYIISNKIPIKINKNKIVIPTIILTLGISVSDKKEKINERTCGIVSRKRKNEELLVILLYK